MRYCIIDDEPIAHRIIEGYCSKLPNLQKVGNCYDAFEAMQLLRAKAVDLIFLDINMPQLTGFEFLRTMQDLPAVIVTSAYKEFALEGYELNVTDYLLKPFSFERFLIAINKVGPKPSPPSIETPPSKQDRLFLKGDKKIHQLQLEDILFVEAYGNYSKVFLIDEMILTHEKISSLEVRLPAANFMRVHKSFIVAIDKIQTLQGNQLHIREHFVPIGQTYRQQVKRIFQE
ncbi:MAG: LytTR family DNA-binding domain-containing protein [Bacteroidota bacterium]